MAAGLDSIIRFGISALGVAVAGVLLQISLDRFCQSIFWCVAAFAGSGIVLVWNLRK